jgi:hypothetical protein
MEFISVYDDLPPCDTPLIAYSEIWGEYCIAQFSPCRGWVTINGTSLATVTHWSTIKIELPFPIRGEFDKEIALKYGYNKDS